MDKVVVEKEVLVTDADRGDSTGSNAIWAIAMVIIVALIAGALYYSGALKKLSSGAPASQKIDVKVDVPAAPAR